MGAGHFLWGRSNVLGAFFSFYTWGGVGESFKLDRHSEKYKEGDLTDR